MRNLDPKVEKDIKKTKEEINDLYMQEIQKKIIFTKQKYYEVGGKSTKLLAYRLRKQQADNSIYKIRNPITKKIEYGSNEFLENFEIFYKNLYSQKQTDADSQWTKILDSLNLPTVSAENNKRLLSEITVEELNIAIARLKVNKSPGPDGFISEWYKSLRESLTPVLLATFNWILKGGVAPPSWREAIILVIPKEGSAKTECGNFRPISVLNVDYKLFTSILARRLDTVIPEQIHLDQTGFVRQRQTQDNIKCSLHIMSHITKNNVEALLVGLDAEKAFDSIRWKYLLKVMNRFGFHKSIIKVIQTLYDKPLARIKVNGNLSN